MLRIIALLTLLATLIGTVPGAAFASSKGRKNTALLLGGATIYSLSKGRGTEALILGAGTYVAYQRYRDSKGRVRCRKVRVRCDGRDRRWRRNSHRH